MHWVGMHLVGIVHTVGCSSGGAVAAQWFVAAPMPLATRCTRQTSRRYLSILGNHGRRWRHLVKCFGIQKTLDMQVVPTQRHVHEEKPPDPPCHQATSSHELQVSTISMLTWPCDCLTTGKWIKGRSPRTLVDAFWRPDNYVLLTPC